MAMNVDDPLPAEGDVARARLPTSCVALASGRLRRHVKERFRAHGRFQQCSTASSKKSEKRGLSAPTIFQKTRARCETGGKGPLPEPPAGPGADWYPKRWRG
jgi:hypothetical protein